MQGEKEGAIWVGYRSINIRIIVVRTVKIAAIVTTRGNSFSNPPRAIASAKMPRLMKKSVSKPVSTASTQILLLALIAVQA